MISWIPLTVGLIFNQPAVSENKSVVEPFLCSEKKIEVLNDSLCLARSFATKNLYFFFPGNTVYARWLPIVATNEGKTFTAYKVERDKGIGLVPIEISQLSLTLDDVPEKPTKGALTYLTDKNDQHTLPGIAFVNKAP